VWDFIWLWNRTEIRNIQITAALVVYTLPLFYSLYVWLSPFWREREAEDLIYEDENAAQIEALGETVETESLTRTR
jgi:hypothetical protein